MLHNGCPQLLAIADPLQVLTVVLLHDDHAVPLAMVRDREPQLFGTHLQTLLNSCIWQEFARVQIVAGLAEEPWIADRSAANHNSVYTGLVKHATGIMWCHHVAVPDDGYLQPRSIFQLLQPLPPGRSEERRVGKECRERCAP